MSEGETSVLKGGTQGDLSQKTFTRTVRRFTSCQLQLGHQLPLFMLGSEGEGQMLERKSVFS